MIDDWCNAVQWHDYTYFDADSLDNLWICIDIKTEMCERQTETAKWYSHCKCTASSAARL